MTVEISLLGPRAETDALLRQLLPIAGTTIVQIVDDRGSTPGEFGGLVRTANLEYNPPPEPWS